jgi:hypothetical protein
MCLPGPVLIRTQACSPDEVNVSIAFISAGARVRGCSRRPHPVPRAVGRRPFDFGLNGMRSVSGRARREVAVPTAEPEANRPGVAGVGPCTAAVVRLGDPLFTAEAEAVEQRVAQLADDSIPILQPGQSGSSVPELGLGRSDIRGRAMIP